MIKENIARVALASASLAAGLRTKAADHEALFVELHAYALERRGIDREKKFPTPEVLARKYHELQHQPFPVAKLEDAPFPMQVLFTTFRAVIAALEPFRSDDPTPIDGEIEAAFTPAVQMPAVDEPGDQTTMPSDVAQLVIAARIVAYQEDGADSDDHRMLDKALEAFASRVPWDDEPKTQEAHDASQGASAVQAKVDEAGTQISGEEATGAAGLSPVGSEVPSEGAALDDPVSADSGASAQPKAATHDQGQEDAPADQPMSAEDADEAKGTAAKKKKTGKK